MDDLKHWDDFASLFDEYWESTLEQEILLKELEGNIDIAKVIWYTIGNNYALKWIHHKIPAFDNLIPIECINDDLLKKSLKMFLMSMPI